MGLENETDQKSMVNSRSQSGGLKHVKLPPVPYSQAFGSISKTKRDALTEEKLPYLQVKQDVSKQSKALIEMKDKDRKLSLANPTLKQLEKFKVYELRKGDAQIIEPPKPLMAKVGNGNPIYHTFDDHRGLALKKRSPLQSPKTSTERHHDEYWSQIINEDVQQHYKQTDLKRIQDRNFQKTQIENKLKEQMELQNS